MRVLKEHQSVDEHPYKYVDRGGNCRFGAGADR